MDTIGLLSRDLSSLHHLVENTIEGTLGDIQTVMLHDYILNVWLIDIVSEENFVLNGLLLACQQTSTGHRWRVRSYSWETTRGSKDRIQHSWSMGAISATRS